MKNTNVLVIKEIQIVYPSIYHLEISQSGRDKIDFGKWRWMDLAELSLAVKGFLGERIYGSDIRERIFECYGVLNNHNNGTPLVTWVLEPGPNSALEYQVNGDPPESCAYEIFVPAR